MSERIIGLMGAMHEEIEGILHLMSDILETSSGMRTYYRGKINNINVVVVFSRWGKVASAATISDLILQFNISELIFTGVAGAVSDDLNVGDIVIAKRLIQHDMDARPLFERYEIPLLEKTFFDTDEYLTKIANKAVRSLLEKKNLHEVISDDEKTKFGIIDPKLLIGEVASGDKFFANKKDKEILVSDLKDILCVEMEGASVAQVCYEYNIPFAVIRTISDRSDDSSHIDFPAFIKNISSIYSKEIIKNIFDQLN